MPRILTLTLLLSLVQVLGWAAPSPAPPDSVLSSKPDSSKRIHPDSTRVFFFNTSTDKYGRLNIHAVDTAVAGVQNYNTLFKDSRFYATLGNTGLSSQSLLPFQGPYQSGFSYGNTTLDPYFFLNDSVRYYKVMKTYTDLEYYQGAHKEIGFDAIFSRNLYKSLNLGFEFRTLSSPGAYQRQKSNLVNFVMTAQYFTPGKRFGVFANLRFNRIKNQENGGIANDTMFTQNTETNRSVIPVNLPDAQNRARESGFYMKSFLNLVNKSAGPNDSTRKKTRNINLGRLIYTFDYSRQIRHYMDPNANAGFYRQTLFDSTETNDSTTFIRISNELAWTNPMFRQDKKFKTLQLCLRMRQEYITIRDVVTGLDSLRKNDSVKFTSKDYLNQWIPSAWMAFQPYAGMRLEANADYAIGDYNNGDFNLRVDLSQVLGGMKRNLGMIVFSGIYSLKEPDWFYHRFTGNNFSWYNDFVKTGIIGGMATWKWKYFDAGVNISRINRYVYLDTAAYPAQLPGDFGYMYLWLNPHADLWRFNITGQLAYQSVQGTNALRLPAFLGSLNIYYSQPLFHNAATLQPGLSFFYNTRYHGNGYMPATRSFYNQDLQETGNYVYMDVFVNIKIQRARIFLIYSNLGGFFLPKDYIMTPTYPMQDPAFKFGLTWRFFD